MMIFIHKLHRFCTIYGCHLIVTTKHEQISVNVQFYQCQTKFRGRNPVLATLYESDFYVSCDTSLNYRQYTFLPSKFR